MKRYLWVALVTGVLALGLAVTRNYGESWDERQFFKYADRALEAYSTWPRTGSVPLTGNTYDNYGPAYVMLTALAARGLGFLLPWSISDLRHLFYFGTFALGLWAFFLLSKRWMSAGAALGATLLMATQPVIWGHAFISPKDIPFLASFVLSLLFGLQMVDGLVERRREAELGYVTLFLRLAAFVWVALVLLLAASTPFVRSWIEKMVRAAAAGDANIISMFAGDIGSADPALYVTKAFVTFLWIRAAAVVLLTVLLAFFWRRVPNAFKSIALLAPAGIALGLSTSIRLLAPLAALMVAIHALRSLGRQALPWLIAYALIGVLVMYVTWPYLWPDPVGHLVESFAVMSRYPWRGEVLFDGTLYASTELPRSYLPVLLGIQFTETAWMSILAGLLLVAAAAIRQDRRARDLLILAVIWCIAPLAAFVITRAPLYDNFRQILFILPPLFMLAGAAFDRIRRLPLQVVVIALAVLPGIAAGVQLHPYEYIYYNRLVGGVQGAFRRFELDYWGTSFRAAADYLRTSAPPNAAVWVEGPTHLLQEYARPDLKIFSSYEPERADHYDYVVALTRFDLDLKTYPEAPIVHAIERHGAALTVIKEP